MSAADAASAPLPSPDAPPQQQQQQQQESTLAKYKRLLTLARRSIEENQRQIAERDAAVDQLRDELAAAQEERRAGPLGQGEPLAALRRVDHDGCAWLLLEYDDESNDDGDTLLGWRKFESEGELAAFASRPGAEPLAVPAASLSPEECEAIRSAAEGRVAQIREDFRKYRVKMELARRQKDAEVQLAYSGGAMGGKSRRASGGAAAGGSEDAERIRELMEEVQNLQADLAEQDQMWRAAYEKQVREAERLRRAGSEAEVAAQWRQRYEAASREKEDALAKLALLASRRHSGDHSGDHSTESSTANGTALDAANAAAAHTALEQKYAALKEEYRLYRRKAIAALQGGPSPRGSELSSSGSAVPGPRRGSSFSERGAAGDEAKMPYLRNLLLKYLGTGDSVARANMERAMGVVLAFSPAEMDDLRARREREEAQTTSAWLSSVTSMLGKGS